MSKSIRFLALMILTTSGLNVFGQNQETSFNIDAEGVYEKYSVYTDTVNVSGQHKTEESIWTVDSSREKTVSTSYSKQVGDSAFYQKTETLTKGVITGNLSIMINNKIYLSGADFSLELGYDTTWSEGEVRFYRNYIFSETQEVKTLLEYNTRDNHIYLQHKAITQDGALNKRYELVLKDSDKVEKEVHK